MARGQRWPVPKLEGDWHAAGARVFGRAGQLELDQQALDQAAVCSPPVRCHAWAS